MGLITGYTPKAVTEKYDTEVAELVEAAKTNPNAAYEIEFSVDGEDEAVTATVKSHTSAFQKAANRAGYTAKVDDKIVDTDSAHVVFVLTTKRVRPTLTDEEKAERAAARAAAKAAAE